MLVQLPVQVPVAADLMQDVEDRPLHPHALFALGRDRAGLFQELGNNLRADHILTARHGQAVNDVLQFPHIAAPSVEFQLLNRIGVNLLLRQAFFGRHGQEMVRQRLNILQPFA